MHKYQLLRERADAFRVVLEEYAQKDRDVADFLQRWMPWYERIQRREIRLPCYDYKLTIYFTNPELSPLSERYSRVANDRLSHWCSLFDEAMRDWLSSPVYLKSLQEQGEQPSAILDELPPPEEETPLPTKGQPKQSRLSWITRFFKISKGVE
jgi:hypothetical protein